MKSTIFTKVLSEEYIEVNKSVSETIKHLRELCGSVRESVPYDAEITFNCSKKGKIIVKKYIPHFPSRRIEEYFQLHKMYGHVISKDNNTFIHIVSVYSRLNLFLQYFLLTICILFCPLYFLSKIAFDKFNLTIFIILAILSTITLICGHTPISRQKKCDLVLLPIMREEIIKRIQIIQSWHN